MTSALVTWMFFLPTVIAWSCVLCCLKGRVARLEAGPAPRPAVPQAGFGVDLNNCQQGCAPLSPQARSSLLGNLHF